MARERESKSGDVCRKHGNFKPCAACVEFDDRVRRAEELWKKNRMLEGEFLCVSSLLLNPDELKAKKVLDLGAGEGELITFLRSKGIDARGIDSRPRTRTEVLSPYFRYVGFLDQGIPKEEIRMDIHEIAEELEDDPDFQELYLPEGLDKGDMQNTPYEDGSFDLIVGTGIGDLPGEEATLLEVKRLLRPNGEARFDSLFSRNILRIAQEDGLVKYVVNPTEEQYLAFRDKKLKGIRKILGREWLVTTIRHPETDGDLLVLKAPLEFEFKVESWDDL